MTGPWGCPGCGWSEAEEYDLSDGRSARKGNGYIDQYGGFHPDGSSMAAAIRMAEDPLEDRDNPHKPCGEHTESDNER